MAKKADGMLCYVPGAHIWIRTREPVDIQDRNASIYATVKPKSVPLTKLFTSLTFGDLGFSIIITLLSPTGFSLFLKHLTVTFAKSCPSRWIFK